MNSTAQHRDVFELEKIIIDLTTENLNLRKQINNPQKNAGKAQIFSSTKGDHYRTRMTHTLIVCQIARSISSILNLNCTLAEAIAIGHDLGHTPFGHQGERTLHAILTGKEGFEVENLPLLVNEEDGEQFPYGGFKHNYQSVRVATSLESQYLEIDGLDLSEQTLNGMWMHTGNACNSSYYYIYYI